MFESRVSKLLYYLNMNNETQNDHFKSECLIDVEVHKQNMMVIYLIRVSKNQIKQLWDCVTKKKDKYL